MNEEGLDNLEQAISEQLLGDAWFAGLEDRIILDEPGDINTAVEQVVAKAKGLAIVVKVTAAGVDSGQSGPYFSPISGEILALEKVTANRSGSGSNKRARAVLMRAARVLNHFVPEGLSNCLQIDKDGIRLVGSIKGVEMYSVGFFTEGGLTTEVATTETPVITSNAGTVSIACATAGAAIFYTVDGSKKPTPNHTLYTAPFAAAAGAKGYARAKVWGKLASAIANHTAA